MTTLESALHAEEEARFVGRERELEVFDAWLSAPTHDVLNVYGPGGVGKSALLRAFARRAGDGGYPVRHVDLSAGSDALDHVGSASAEPSGTELLILDTLDAAPSLLPDVRDRLIPELDGNVKVVIAGRTPVVGGASGRPWAGRSVRAMTLEGLSREDAGRLLARRGIEDPAVRERVIAAAGSLPLALTVAADMVQHLGIAYPAAAPEWQLAVNSLVEQVIDEVDDESLRDLLDVAAVVWRFDESVLAGILGRPVEAEFYRLCRLSFVKATDRGLQLHDDVRGLMLENLRWKRADRYDELFALASRYFRERMASASGEVRARLVNDRLYLFQGSFMRRLAFEHPYGAVWPDAFRLDEKPALLALWDEWRNLYGGAGGYAEYQSTDPDENRAFLHELLSSEYAIVTVARDRSGEPLAFGTIIPVVEQLRGVISRNPALAQLVGACPSVPSGDLYYLGAIVHKVDVPIISAALIRPFMQFMVRGGTFIASTSHPLYTAALSDMNFAPLPGATFERDGAEPLQGYILECPPDLIEAWLTAMMSGSPVPGLFAPGEFEAEVLKALQGWNEPAVLRSSKLLALVPDRSSDPAEGLRAWMREGLERARDRADWRLDTALQAVEVGYMGRASSLEQVAEALHLSRSTFFRSLRKGVSALAAALRS